MEGPASYDYAVFRFVPRVETGEFLNVGVILYCRTRRFLGVRYRVDWPRVSALAPWLDKSELSAHLAALSSVANGGDQGGPIGSLDQHQRFHWLVAPRSTVLQVSPVHCGICDDPSESLIRLLDREVGGGSATTESHRTEP